MSEEPLFRELDQAVILRALVEGTVAETGGRFFYALVENLQQVLRTSGAWVTEYLPQTNRLRAHAFMMHGNWVEDYEFDVQGTPCEAAILQKELVHFPDQLIELYPNDPDIKQAGFVSYMGMPLMDTNGEVLGHLAVVDSRPMPSDPQLKAVFQIFAARAASELQRIRREKDIVEREQKLDRLVGSAMDAIIELDDQLLVTRVNQSAVGLLGMTDAEVVGQPLVSFLAEPSQARLTEISLETLKLPAGKRSQWIAGGLQVITHEGSEVPVEATLSSFDISGKHYFTLIVRDVNERIEAEKRITSLTNETEYLKQQLDKLQSSTKIIGKSKSIQQVFQAITQVAQTDASVLILGETGTGKELVAQAIHDQSSRCDQPMIKVNCAAIPESLIESEFCGHEVGAFTGATKKREGRFALADGGTIFLDEVGELPLDLQAKLLRVLQEGEFEPVGSSETQKVDVRVITATHRDLEQASQAGTFRSDLFYRLNVFPIALPALREREEDVVILANLFIDRFSKKMVRDFDPLDSIAVAQLKGYQWPGNVRELENVIERALITATQSKICFLNVLPVNGVVGQANLEADQASGAPAIRTMQELQQLEHDNIVCALDQVDWKVSGEQGAAKLLGIKPTTLSSKMKSLGIARP